MEQPFIVYDSQIFDQQKFGGISRYFCEIMSNLQFNYDIAVRYTENHYLLNSKIKRHGIYIPHLFFKYHQQKLYQSNAKLILKLMQKHAPFVYHPTYYNPLFLRQIGNNPFVITVHDMTYEKYPDLFQDSISIIQQKKEIIAKLEKGQVLEGTVKNITSYGVFIDLGGVDGLIHITDLSWGRVSDPKEVVELDQKLNVVILDFDDEKKRIALGLKQLTPHPWDALDANLQVGDKVKGKVVVMADYGAFIEIAPGVEGLIHVSEMSWSQHLRSAQDFMKVGDEVEAVILTLDRDERKMSLGIKQLKQDPWETIEEKYPVGSKHTAKVRNFTNFGVFVEIEEGVDGLIHISDLSWTKKVKHPSEFTQIGADIEVQVLEIDKENRRLSLGHKQLEENPWDVFETVFTVGSVHEGTIIEMLDKGAVVALPYGVEGFATPKHLVKEDGSQAQLDEKLSFKVIEFNKDAKRIILSHSRIFEDAAKAEERAEKKAASNAKKATKREETPAIQNQAASTTLGDIDALAALKEQLENKKK